MTYIRRLILALALSAGLAPAFAQVPPPVPALPDTERRTSYSISASTCACSVGFALYGDSTDYANWIEVFVNGVRMAQAGNWTLSSVTGTIGSIPLPITNAVLTFTAPQTGTIQIVGARRPRRTSQFNEGAGIPTRNMNVVVSDITATLREMWDKNNDMTGRGLFSQPGVTLSTLPLPSACAGKFLGFDVTGFIPTCTSGGAGSGNVVGPAGAIDGHFAFFNGTSGALLKDGGAAAAIANSGSATDLVAGTVPVARLPAFVGDSGAGGTLGAVPAPAAGTAAADQVLMASGSFGVVGLTGVGLSKTANYTVANTDKGKSLGLSGSAYFTLTFSAPAGYDADFCVRVYNHDSDRAKLIALSGFPSFTLWPGQSSQICKPDGVWHVSPPIQRWAPGAAVTFFVATTGSDTLNDGLAVSGNGPFATLQKCVNIAQQFLDVGVFNATCKLADGTYATGATNGGGGALINGPLVGSGYLNITGNSVTPTNVVLDGAASAYCIQAQNYAQVTVNYVQCKNAALLFTAPINSAWMQLCGVDAGSTTAGGSQFYISRQSYMEIICTVTSSGTTAGYGFQVSHQGNFRATALLTGNTLLTYNSNITYSIINVYVASGGDFTLTQYPSAAATPWNANGKTITGQKWGLDSGGVYQSLGISGACSQEPLGTTGGFITGFGSFNQGCHPTPVVSGCGTSPANAGNDYYGFVVEGTTATGCTITFNVAFSNIPFCTISYRSAIPASMVYAVTASALTITHTSTSNPSFGYKCDGF